MSRHGWIFSGLFALTLSVPCLAGEPAPASLTDLQQQITQLRQELATTKLQLEKTLDELRELREYLASADPAADIQQWRQQRQALEQERQQLAEQRKQLEAARRSMRDVTR